MTVPLPKRDATALAGRGGPDLSAGTTRARARGRRATRTDARDDAKGPRASRDDSGGVDVRRARGKWTSRRTSSRRVSVLATRTRADSLRVVPCIQKMFIGQLKGYAIKC
eukprot:30507-Pelagococcus_subviridis.AAC.2